MRRTNNRFGVKSRYDWKVVYEDRDLLVVSKPPGLLTSTVPREKRPTLLALVRQYVAEHDRRARVGLIHRLDRDAQGLLVFSKCNEAYQSLKSQFFHHTVKRAYMAVVQGTPRQKAGTIRSRLIERADGTVYSTDRPSAGDMAMTEYATLSSSGNRSILRVVLQTGRKHQVRVHLSERGTPVIGDSMYGRPDPAGLHLAATELAFDHPRTGERVEFKYTPSFAELKDQRRVAETPRKIKK
jgi:23S rRNA pseudouridine1911/1915/1917 synthase